MRLLLTTALVTCLPALTLAAEDDHKSLGAHEHGAGVFNVAMEGEMVAMELEAPGADIVGFEHAAESKKDKAAIKKAKATLKNISKVVALPASAECKLTAASVELHTEGGDHDDHDHGKKAEKHDDHDDHDHDHKKKAEKHDDHDHDHDHKKKAEKHDDHDDHDHDHKKKAEKHDDHDDHDHDHKKKAEKHDDHDHDHDHKKKAEKHDDHDDHDHEKHAGEEGGHTEFHAEYQLDCHHPEKLTKLTFTYFKTFKNAEKLSVSVAGSKSQTKAEANRKNVTVSLGGSS